MKKSLGIFLLITIFCWNCQKNNEYSDEFRDISKSFSYSDFENTKTFILENGDRQTYCNLYLDNPHYSFEGFETYLNPEIGQKNMLCDPEVSDFNEIVIRDLFRDPQYYHILIVRRGDLKNKDISFNFLKGMKEGKVFLLKYYEEDDLDLMESNLDDYLELINNEINSH